MADSLYITATESRSGKSAISLGVMEMLARKICKVGFLSAHHQRYPGIRKTG